MHQFEEGFALAVPVNLRLALSLIAYAVLGVLAWRTMEADKIRLVTFAILGLFAFRTITQAARLKREEAAGQSAIENEKFAKTEVVAECRMPSADGQEGRE